MQKLLIYILLLIIIGHVLATNGIIPPLENILILLAPYQTMLRPLLNDSSSLVISFLLSLPKLISSIPFHAINIWYVLGFLFITSVNPITAALVEKYETIKGSYEKDQEYLAAITVNGIWIKEKKKFGKILVGNRSKKNN